MSFRTPALLLSLICLSGCTHTATREMACPLEEEVALPLEAIPHDNDVKLLTPGTAALEQARQIEELQANLQQTTMHLRRAGDDHQMLLQEIEEALAARAELESEVVEGERQLADLGEKLAEKSTMVDEQARQIEALSRQLIVEKERVAATGRELQSLAAARDAELTETMEMLDQLIAKYGIDTADLPSKEQSAED